MDSDYIISIKKVTSDKMPHFSKSDNPFNNFEENINKYGSVFIEPISEGNLSKRADVILGIILTDPYDELATSLCIMDTNLYKLINYECKMCLMNDKSQIYMQNAQIPLRSTLDFVNKQIIKNGNIYIPFIEPLILVGMQEANIIMKYCKFKSNAYFKCAVLEANLRALLSLKTKKWINYTVNKIVG
jgi:hypothetical protein